MKLYTIIEENIYSKSFIGLFLHLYIKAKNNPIYLHSNSSFFFKSFSSLCLFPFLIY